MTANELCPKHGCGWRGTPLENLSVQPLYNLSEHHFECCLWHESNPETSSGLASRVTQRLKTIWTYSLATSLSLQDSKSNDPSRRSNGGLNE